MALQRETGFQILHIQDTPYNTKARYDVLKASGIEFSVATVAAPAQPCWRGRCLHCGCHNKILEVANTFAIRGYSV